MSFPKMLDSISLFSDLTPDERGTVAGLCQWRIFDKDQYIIDKNDEDTDIYFITDGSIRVLNYSLGGKEVSYADIDAGSYFGELSAIDGQPRSAAVIAKTVTQVAVLSSTQLHQIIEAYPRIALTLLKKMASFLRFASSRIFEMSTQQAHHRVALEILRMIETNKVIADGNTLMLSPAPKQLDLATRIGSTRETVARAFRKLTDDGVIKRVTRGLHIINIDTLRSLAEHVE